MKQNTSTAQENWNKELEVLSTTLIQQFICIESLIHNGWQDSVYQQIVENEKIIDKQEDLYLKNSIIQGMVLFPKAKLLRKMRSTHEAVRHIENMSDLTVNMADCLKKIDLTQPIPNPFQNDLQKTFDILKNIVQTVLFGFFTEDINNTYPITKKNEEIEKLLQKISENLLTFYQGKPLSNDELQCLLSLNCVLHLIEKIQKCTFVIAKLIIFVAEGTNIRHQRFER